MKRQSQSSFIRRGHQSLAAIIGILALSLPSTLAHAETGNVATGTGNSELISITTGSYNTADGFDALKDDRIGSYNTATGYEALLDNTGGNDNTATGRSALEHNDANFSTADGYEALYSNTTGTSNVAVGYQALYSNFFGYNNTAIGVQALYSGQDGDYNTACGYQALEYNANGSSGNCAFGAQTMQNCTQNGGYNTGVGSSALYGGSNATFEYETALGNEALVSDQSGNDNVAAGAFALESNTSGYSNTAIGFGSGTNVASGTNDIYIGAQVNGTSDESNVIRIGNPAVTGSNGGITCIGGIWGAQLAGEQGTEVYIDATGHLGTKQSSRQFKKDIAPMDKASDILLKLKPVTFRYKSDPTASPQFGLVAEEVEKVDPDLVVRDAKGEIFSVRYDAVNAMLLNEFLKEHKCVEEQGRQFVAQQKDFQTALAAQQQVSARQQQEIKELTAALKEQSSQLRKVSAEVEAARPAPRVAANNALQE